MNALDLIPGEQVSGVTLAKAKVFLKQNYGLEYSEEKFAMLFQMIDEERWTEERFKRTFSWFLKNKKFPSWTIADWFEFGIKVYPYAWYLQQIDKQGREFNRSIDWYRLPDGTLVCKPKDGNDLPFQRVP